ncbi:MAG: hypothetical protein ACOX8N_09180 [Christensenellales bacterium]|jgi:predicted DNA-binding protein (UPF0251 family)
MTNVEMFLRDYWHAKRSIGRLKLALTEACAAYERGAADVRCTSSLQRVGRKRSGGESAVERAAILLVDELGAEVKAIEKRLMDERRTIAHIEAVVAAASLHQQEMEYVRARYFDNLSVEAVAQRMYCSTVTCWRLKKSALEKIGAVLNGTRPVSAREA